MRRLTALLVLLALALGAGACGGDDDDDVTTDSTGTTEGTTITTEPDQPATGISDEAVIEYHYGDSSVPPEYHRSYTLTITKDEVHAVVDSYGDVLHDVTEPLPAEVWQQLVDTADEVLDLEVNEDEEPCAGGTSRGLTIEDGGSTLVDVSFGDCGGSNPSASSTVDDWVQPVLDAIPDWETYLATD